MLASLGFGRTPLGGKFAVMNGQTLQKGFIPLPTGAKAIYTSSGLTYYRHHDQVGSSRLATTPSQTLYSSTAYAPFGEPYKQAGTTDLSFTGQDQDTISGMHDFQDRRFIPVQGRWLTPDPAGLSAVNMANPQSWNRYAYVNNNPLAMIDPFGDDGCYANMAYCTVNGTPGAWTSGGGPTSIMNEGGSPGYVPGSDLNAGLSAWLSYLIHGTYYPPGSYFASEYCVDSEEEDEAAICTPGGGGTITDYNAGDGNNGQTSSQCLVKVQNAVQNALGQTVSYQGQTPGTEQSNAFNFNFLVAGYTGGIGGLCGRYLPPGLFGAVTGIGPSLHIVSQPGFCNPMGDPTNTGMTPDGFLVTAHIDSAFGWNPIGFIWHEVVDVLLKRNHGC